MSVPRVGEQPYLEPYSQVLQDPTRKAPKSVHELPWRRDADPGTLAIHQKMVFMLMNDIDPRTTWPREWWDRVMQQEAKAGGSSQPVEASVPQLVSPVRPGEVDPEALTWEQVLQRRDRHKRLVLGEDWGVVYVFACGPEEVREASQWARPWLISLAKTKDDVERAVAYGEVQPILQMCQVIACCRQGPTRESPRSFDPRYLRELLVAMPQGHVSRIYQASEALSGAVDLFREAAEAFFETAQGYFERLSSALSTWADCPEDLREQTQEMSSGCTRLTSLVRPW